MLDFLEKQKPVLPIEQPSDFAKLELIGKAIDDTSHQCDAFKQGPTRT